MTSSYGDRVDEGPRTRAAPLVRSRTCRLPVPEQDPRRGVRPALRTRGLASARGSPPLPPGFWSNWVSTRASAWLLAGIRWAQGAGIPRRDGWGWVPRSVSVSCLGPEVAGSRTKALYACRCTARADCGPTRALLDDRVLFSDWRPLSACISGALGSCVAPFPPSRELWVGMKGGWQHLCFPRSLPTGPGFGAGH